MVHLPKFKEDRQASTAAAAAARKRPVGRPPGTKNRKDVSSLPSPAVQCEWCGCDAGWAWCDAGGVVVVRVRLWVCAWAVLWKGASKGPPCCDEHRALFWWRTALSWCFISCLVWLKMCIHEQRAKDCLWAKSSGLILFLFEDVKPFHLT